MPEQALLSVALAVFVCSTFAAVRPAARGGTLERARWPVLALGAAGVVTGVAVWLRWARTGHGPFITFFDVLLSNVFSLALIATLAWSIFPLARAGAPLVSAVLAVLAAWCLRLPAEPVPLPATFDSPWLWAHVVAGKVFLGACLVAVGVGVTLIRARATDGRLDAVAALAWDLLRVAFLFETAMLLAGAVWARDAWGRYWGWDPVETWALVTWLVLGAALHAHARSRLPVRFAGWVALGVFALAHLTFLGVPFLSAGPHKGIG